MEYTKEVLRKIINTIKTRGARKGDIITNEEIAKTINLSNDLLSSYLEGNGIVPEDIMSNLLSSYDIQIKVFTHIVEHEVRFLDKSDPDNQE